MDWRHDAACRDEDPELFFPIGNFGPALIQIEEAKAVCQRCPVSSACLKWALESGQDGGVWAAPAKGEGASSASAAAYLAPRSEKHTPEPPSRFELRLPP